VNRQKCKIKRLNMNTIYSVTISGRTFQSRDLKELLARAVSVKRNMKRASMVENRQCGILPAEEPAQSFSATEMAAVH
jgi:hypothetical protein